ncbi:MAG: restriction endonuclease subunit R [Cyanobacteriota bacterium]|nr:restriction endonuclease subunit R [Cyanobacteriota bacterium]
MSLPASPSLQDIETQFDLQQIDRDSLFLVELDEIPELTDEEKQRLERARSQYLNLRGQSAIATLVGWVLLSPLLDLAGFYALPLDFSARNSIALAEGDEEAPSGRIDLLVVGERLWIAVVESQWASATPQEALPAVLQGMMAEEQRDRVRFGLITNGRESLFVRLNRAESPQYALSQTYSLSGLGFEFYEVLRNLKAIARVLFGLGNDAIGD